MINFPAEIEDEFKELQFALENTERGGWFFAVYKQWKVAEELIQRLRNSTQLPIFEWQYSQDKPSYPVDYLHYLTEQQKTQRAMVMLFHVASGGEKVIKSLDFNRELFSDYPHCLLFWVTETELREIANGAGHFWAQRGGRFDFSQFFIPEIENTANYQSSDWAGLLIHIENYKEAEKQLEFYLAELEERQNENETLALAELYDKISYLLYCLGKYNEATPYCEKTLAIKEKVLGKDNLDVANSLYDLANLYLHQGLYEEALPLIQNSLAIKKKQLGENHLNVSTVLDRLATVYQYQGYYSKALPLFQKALATLEKQLGKNHPDVASSLNNLAGLYRCQGNYEEASSLYQKALVIYENTLGKYHLYVATTLNNLAEMYTIQGNYEQALVFHLRALAIREKLLGEHHPDIANSFNNLAGLYETQERYDEALPLYQRAITIVENSLGKEHPHTQTVANNYARLQGKMAKK